MPCFLMCLGSTKRIVFRKVPKNCERFKYADRSPVELTAAWTDTTSQVTDEHFCLFWSRTNKNSCARRSLLLIGIGKIFCRFAPQTDWSFTTVRHKKEHARLSRALRCRLFASKLPFASRLCQHKLRSCPARSDVGRGARSWFPRILKFHTFLVIF